jgi:transposase
MARKFTPKNIARIKDWVAQGIGRKEIASRLDVSVGSLQATCSRLRIGLRRRSAGVQRSIEHVRQDHAVQAKLTLVMETRNRQAAFDLPLDQNLLVQLALEASVRDLATAYLIGKIVNQVIEKDLVREVLTTGSSPSRRD